jgi:hypothetical protein
MSSCTAPYTFFGGYSVSSQPAGSAKNRRIDAPLRLTGTGLYISNRVMAVFVVIVVGFAVAFAGVLAGFSNVMADTGRRESIRITADAGEYPRAAGYLVSGKSYAVYGRLKDGTDVEWVVEEYDYKAGKFTLWVRHRPGKPPELGTGPLSLEFPHRTGGIQLLITGGIIFALGVLAGCLEALARWRKRRRT